MYLHDEVAAAAQAEGCYDLTPAFLVRLVFVRREVGPWQDKEDGLVEHSCERVLPH
jgi:hypothetical protein